MANMERIIRPHLPANIAPPEKAPKCQVPPENTIAKFDAPEPALTATLDKINSGTEGTPASSRPIHKQSQYSYSIKTYMTKKEREKGKPGTSSGGEVTDGTTGTTDGGGGGGGSGGVPTPQPRPPEAPGGTPGA